MLPWPAELAKVLHTLEQIQQDFNSTHAERRSRSQT
jgi:catalase (peroxidase I)